jgi:hypothetical protein
MLEDEEEKRWIVEMNRMRRVAFFGVTSSAISISVVIILIPLLYSHIQRAQTKMHDKVDFCKFRSTTVWREISRTEVLICLG